MTLVTLVLETSGWRKKKSGPSVVEMLLDQWTRMKVTSESRNLLVMILPESSEEISTYILAHLVP